MVPAGKAENLIAQKCASQTLITEAYSLAIAFRQPETTFDVAPAHKKAWEAPDFDCSNTLIGQGKIAFFVRRPDRNGIALQTLATAARRLPKQRPVRLSLP